MATATPAQQTAIINLYVALFNRAPDADGFAFWTQALANGASLTTVTGAFFASPESTASYPASQTASQFVSAFYQTVFGRTADAEGLAFWTGVLDSAGGIDSEDAKTLLVSKIVDIVSTPLAERPADLSDEQYAETVRDRNTFTKKHAAAIDFVDHKGTDLEAARQALLDAVAPAPAPTPTPTDQTYTLTTGTDTPIGTTGNDRFNAPQVVTGIDQNLSDTQTLNNEDVLDGGAGTDTLTAQLFISSSVKPTLKNIEIVRVSVGSSNAGLDLADSAGFLDVGFDNGVSDGTLYNVGNASLSVSNQNATAHFNGSTAAALSLSLSNVGNIPELFSLRGISATTVDLAYNGDGALATTHNIGITDHFGLPAMLDVHGTRFDMSGHSGFPLSPKPGASRFQAYDYAPALRLGLGAAITKLLASNVDEARTQILAMAAGLRDRMMQIDGVTLADAGGSGLVCLRMIGVDHQTVVRRLWQRDINIATVGAVYAPLAFGADDSVLRLSPHVLNQAWELDCVQEAIVQEVDKSTGK